MSIRNAEHSLFRNKRSKLFLSEFYAKGSLLYADAVELIFFFNKKLEKLKVVIHKKVRQIYCDKKT